MAQGQHRVWEHCAPFSASASPSTCTEIILPPALISRVQTNIFARRLKPPTCCVTSQLQREATPKACQAEAEKQRAVPTNRSSVCATNGQCLRCLWCVDQARSLPCFLCLHQISASLPPFLPLSLLTIPPVLSLLLRPSPFPKRRDAMSCLAARGWRGEAMPKGGREGGREEGRGKYLGQTAARWREGGGGWVPVEGLLRDGRGRRGGPGP